MERRLPSPKSRNHTNGRRGSRFDEATIDAAIARGVDRFCRIDCVVINAGQRLFSVFEATPLETIREVFETNVFGAMQVMRTVLL